MLFKIKNLGSHFIVTCTNQDYLLMEIPKHKSFEPFLKEFNKIWYIIYMSYPHIIKRVNLTALTAILTIKSIPKSIGIKIIGYLDLEDYSDKIQIAPRLEFCKMSPNRKILHSITYDGYETQLCFYSLKTFNPLKTPAPIIIDYFDVVEYSEINNETIITCSLKEEFQPLIGKWAFPISICDFCYLEEFTSTDDVVSGLDGQIQENYYTHEDVRTLRTLLEDDIYGEEIIIESYRFKCDDQKDELILLDHFIDEKFYKIFKYKTGSNVD